MKENWRPIPGAPGYFASDRGRVKGPRVVLKPSRMKNGYLGVKVGGKSTTVHAAVARAFHGEPPTTKHTVNHKNGAKTDNKPANLEWVTHLENMRHAVDVLGIKFGGKPQRTPVNPPERRPGQYAGYIEIHDAINGWTIRRDLAVPSDRGQRRARVDSWTMVHDGKQQATGGWHALFRFLVSNVLPVPMSLRGFANLER